MSSASGWSVRAVWVYAAVCAVVAAIAPAWGAAGGAAGQERSKPLTIVATVAMVGDVVREVAGERAEVSTLLGEGIDPHAYKLTRTDLAAMMNADAVFYSGLLLEGKMTDALVRLATGGRKVFAVTQAVPEDQLLHPEGFEGNADPHVWMDPTLWALTAGFIAERLGEIDPAGKAVYAANAQRVMERFTQLDAYAKKVVSSVPEKSRVLVTAHDAFGYFGRRYGLEVVGIQGISTESEAGVKDIERLVELIVSRGIRAIFVETSVSDRNISALVAGARARGHEVVIGGSLFSDAMGKPGTYEGTYVGMMDHNATLIARALGGTAPAKGMSGSLADAASKGDR